MHQARAAELQRKVLQPESNLPGGLGVGFSSSQPPPQFCKLTLRLRRLSIPLLRVLLAGFHQRSELCTQPSNLHHASTTDSTDSNQWFAGSRGDTIL